MLVERVCRGRFHDVTLALCGCGACERIVALLCALSWVAVRLRDTVCWYVGVLPLTQGGILRALRLAGDLARTGRREFAVRASAIVPG